MKEITVTIDRLKPAYIIADDFPKDTSRNTTLVLALEPIPKEDQRTRSSRRVNFLDSLQVELCWTQSLVGSDVGRTDNVRSCMFIVI